MPTQIAPDQLWNRSRHGYARSVVGLSVCSLTKENYMRKQLEISGGLMFAMVVSGLILVPCMGWWPLVGVAAACGTSVYIAGQFNKRR